MPDQPAVPQPTHDPLTLDESNAWGRAFGAALAPGSVVALHGELGAGKTTLVRAICEGLGVSDPDAVTSPTFALLHEYDVADGVVVHADLYRLKSSGELAQFGWDELLARARATLVEWPERATEWMPDATLHVQLQHVPNQPNVRRIRVIE